jgi:hypothetical protein
MHLPWCRLPGQGIIGEQQLRLAQALELVAQAGGFLELQVRGGVAHLLLKLLERHLHVAADQLALVHHAGLHMHAVLLVRAVENVGDVALHAFRRDAVFFIVGDLLFAAAVGLGNRALHASRSPCRHRARRLPSTLRAARPMVWISEVSERRKPFLVGIQNGHQRAFGNVEALAQQVDADQHVERAEAQIADDLDALHRVDVGVHVAHAHAVFVQIFGQVFGHALGQRRDQRAVAGRGHLFQLAEQIVHLVGGRADVHRRVDQPGGADHLFGEHAAGLLQLPRRRRGRDMRWSAGAWHVPFLKAQRPVVHAGGQAEAIFGQRRLAAEVAAIHRADLRDGLVGLIDEDQRVVGDVLEQGGRRLAGLAPGER